MDEIFYIENAEDNTVILDLEDNNSLDSNKTETVNVIDLDKSVIDLDKSSPSHSVIDVNSIDIKPSKTEIKQAAKPKKVFKSCRAKLNKLPKSKYHATPGSNLVMDCEDEEFERPVSPTPVVVTLSDSDDEPQIVDQTPMADSTTEIDTVSITSSPAKGNKSRSIESLVSSQNTQTELLETEEAPVTTTTVRTSKRKRTKSAKMVSLLQTEGNLPSSIIDEITSDRVYIPSSVSLQDTRQSETVDVNVRPVTMIDADHNSIIVNNSNCTLGEMNQFNLDLQNSANTSQAGTTYVNIELPQKVKKKPGPKPKKRGRKKKTLAVAADTTEPDRDQTDNVTERSDSYTISNNCDSRDKRLFIRRRTESDQHKGLNTIVGNPTPINQDDTVSNSALRWTSLETDNQVLERSQRTHPLVNTKQESIQPYDNTQNIRTLRVQDATSITDISQIRNSVSNEISRNTQTSNAPIQPNQSNILQPPPSSIYTTIVNQVPNMNQPNMNQHNMNQPNVNQSQINQRKVNQMNINQPNLNHPTISLIQPTINQPNVNHPNINQPNITYPSINQSNLNQPNINQQNINQPNINQPTMNAQSMHQSPIPNTSQPYNFMNTMGYPPQSSNNLNQFSGYNPSTMPQSQHPFSYMNNPNNPPFPVGNIQQNTSISQVGTFPNMTANWMQMNQQQMNQQMNQPMNQQMMGSSPPPPPPQINQQQQQINQMMEMMTKIMQNPNFNPNLNQPSTAPNADTTNTAPIKSPEKMDSPTKPTDMSPPKEGTTSKRVAKKSCSGQSARSPAKKNLPVVCKQELEDETIDDESVDGKESVTKSSDDASVVSETKSRRGRKRKRGRKAASGKKDVGLNKDFLSSTKPLSGVSTQKTDNGKFECYIDRADKGDETDDDDVASNTSHTQFNDVAEKSPVKNQVPEREVSELDERQNRKRHKTLSGSKKTVTPKKRDIDHSRQTFLPTKRLEVMEFAFLCGNKLAAEKFCIPEEYVNEWNGVDVIPLLNVKHLRVKEVDIDTKINCYLIAQKNKGAETSIVTLSKFADKTARDVHGVYSKEAYCNWATKFIIRHDILAKANNIPESQQIKRKKIDTEESRADFKLRLESQIPITVSKSKIPDTIRSKIIQYVFVFGYESVSSDSFPVSRSSAYQWSCRDISPFLDFSLICSEAQTEMNHKVDKLLITMRQRKQTISFDSISRHARSFAKAIYPENHTEEYNKWAIKFLHDHKIGSKLAGMEEVVEKSDDSCSENTESQSSSVSASVTENSKPDKVERKQTTVERTAIVEKPDPPKTRMSEKRGEIEAAKPETPKAAISYQQDASKDLYNEKVFVARLANFAKNCSKNGLYKSKGGHYTVNSRLKILEYSFVYNTTHAVNKTKVPFSSIQNIIDKNDVGDLLDQSVLQQESQCSITSDLNKWLLKACRRKNNEISLFHIRKYARIKFLKQSREEVISWAIKFLTKHNVIEKLRQQWQPAEDEEQRKSVEPKTEAKPSPVSIVRNKPSLTRPQKPVEFEKSKFTSAQERDTSSRKFGRSTKYEVAKNVLVTRSGPKSSQSRISISSSSSKESLAASQKSRDTSSKKDSQESPITRSLKTKESLNISSKKKPLAPHKKYRSVASRLGIRKVVKVKLLRIDSVKQVKSSLDRTKAFDVRAARGCKTCQDICLCKKIVIKIEDDDEEDVKPSIQRDANGRYTDVFKEEVISFAFCYGISKAAKQFGILGNVIAGWLKRNVTKAFDSKSPSSRKRGRSSLLTEDIHTWIAKLKKHGKDVSILGIMKTSRERAYELYPQNPEMYEKWAKDFYVQYNIANILLGRVEPDDSQETEVDRKSPEMVKTKAFYKTSDDRSNKNSEVLPAKSESSKSNTVHRGEKDDTKDIKLRMPNTATKIKAESGVETNSQNKSTKSTLKTGYDAKTAKVYTYMHMKDSGKVEHSNQGTEFSERRQHQAILLGFTTSIENASKKLRIPFSQIHVWMMSPVPSIGLLTFTDARDKRLSSHENAIDDWLRSQQLLNCPVTFNTLSDYARGYIWKRDPENVETRYTNWAKNLVKRFNIFGDTQELKESRRLSKPQDISPDKKPSKHTDDKSPSHSSNRNFRCRPFSASTRKDAIEDAFLHGTEKAAKRFSVSYATLKFNWLDKSISKFFSSDIVRNDFPPELYSWIQSCVQSKTAMKASKFISIAREAIPDRCIYIKWASALLEKFDLVEYLVQANQGVREKNATELNNQVSSTIDDADAATVSPKVKVVQGTSKGSVKGDGSVESEVTKSSEYASNDSNAKKSSLIADGLMFGEKTAAQINQVPIKVVKSLLHCDISKCERFTDAFKYNKKTDGQLQLWINAQIKKQLPVTLSTISQHIVVLGTSLESLQVFNRWVSSLKRQDIGRWMTKCQKTTVTGKQKGKNKSTGTSEELPLLDDYSDLDSIKSESSATTLPDKSENLSVSCKSESKNTVEIEDVKPVVFPSYIPEKKYLKLTLNDFRQTVDTSNHAVKFEVEQCLDQIISHIILDELEMTKDNQRVKRCVDKIVDSISKLVPNSETYTRPSETTSDINNIVTNRLNDLTTTLGRLFEAENIQETPEKTVTPLSKESKEHWKNVTHEIVRADAPLCMTRLARENWKMVVHDINSSFEQKIGVAEVKDTLDVVMTDVETRQSIASATSTEIGRVDEDLLWDTYKEDGATDTESVVDEEYDYNEEDTECSEDYGEMMQKNEDNGLAQDFEDTDNDETSTNMEEKMCDLENLSCANDVHDNNELNGPEIFADCKDELTHDADEFIQEEVDNSEETQLEIKLENDYYDNPDDLITHMGEAIADREDTIQNTQGTDQSVENLIEMAATTSDTEQIVDNESLNTMDTDKCMDDTRIGRQETMHHAKGTSNDEDVTEDSGGLKHIVEDLLVDMVETTHHSEDTIQQLSNVVDGLVACKDEFNHGTDDVIEDSKEAGIRVDVTVDTEETTQETPANVEELEVDEENSNHDSEDSIENIVTIENGEITDSKEATQETPPNVEELKVDEEDSNQDSEDSIENMISTTENGKEITDTEEATYETTTNVKVGEEYSNHELEDSIENMVTTTDNVDSVEVTADNTEDSMKEITNDVDKDQFQEEQFSNVVGELMENMTETTDIQDTADNRDEVDDETVQVKSENVEEELREDIDSVSHSEDLLDNEDEANGNKEQIADNIEVNYKEGLTICTDDIRDDSEGAHDQKETLGITDEPSFDTEASTSDTTIDGNNISETDQIIEKIDQVIGDMKDDTRDDEEVCCTNEVNIELLDKIGARNHEEQNVEHPFTQEASLQDQVAEGLSNDKLSYSPNEPFDDVASQNFSTPDVHIHAQDKVIPDSTNQDVTVQTQPSVHLTTRDEITGDETTQDVTSSRPSYGQQTLTEDLSTSQSQGLLTDPLTYDPVSQKYIFEDHVLTREEKSSKELTEQPSSTTIVSSQDVSTEDQQFPNDQSQGQITESCENICDTGPSHSDDNSDFEEMDTSENPCDVIAESHDRIELPIKDTNEDFNGEDVELLEDALGDEFMMDIDEDSRQEMDMDS